MKHVRSTLLIGLFCFAAACAATDPATGVLVVVDAEPGVRAAAQKLRVTVRGADNDAGVLADRYGADIAPSHGPIASASRRSRARQRASSSSRPTRFPRTMASSRARAFAAATSAENS